MARGAALVFAAHWWTAEAQSLARKGLGPPAAADSQNHTCRASVRHPLGCGVTANADHNDLGAVTDPTAVQPLLATMCHTMPAGPSPWSIPPDGPTPLFNRVQRRGRRTKGSAMQRHGCQTPEPRAARR